MISFEIDAGAQVDGQMYEDDSFISCSDHRMHSDITIFSFHDLSLDIISFLSCRSRTRYILHLTEFLVHDLTIIVLEFRQVDIFDNQNHINWYIKWTWVGKIKVHVQAYLSQMGVKVDHFCVHFSNFYRAFKTVAARMRVEKLETALLGMRFFWCTKCFLGYKRPKWFFGIQNDFSGNIIIMIRILIIIYFDGLSDIPLTPLPFLPKKKTVFEQSAQVTLVFCAADRANLCPLLTFQKVFAAYSAICAAVCTTCLCWCGLLFVLFLFCVLLLLLLCFAFFCCLSCVCCRFWVADRWKTHPWRFWPYKMSRTILQLISSPLLANNQLENSLVSQK